MIDSCFVPHRITHSSKHILSWDWSAGLNLASDFDAFKFHRLPSLAAEVIAPCAC